MLPGVGPATLTACRAAPGAAATWERIVAGKGRDIGAIADVARRAKPAGSLDELTRTARELDPEAVLSRHEAAGQQVISLGSPALSRAPGGRPRATGTPVRPGVAGRPGRAHRRHRRAPGTPPASDARRRRRWHEAWPSVRGVGHLRSGPRHRWCCPSSRSSISMVAKTATRSASRSVSLPSGLDRPYPRRHQLLHHQVAALGAADQRDADGQPAVAAGDFPPGIGSSPAWPMRWSSSSRDPPEVRC